MFDGMSDLVSMLWQGRDRGVRFLLEMLQRKAELAYPVLSKL